MNSTGDAGDDDPGDGCDTGGTVGADPECTLRAAIETATQAGGGEVTFAIAGGGVPTIEVGAEPLPAVSAGTSIDGTTQEAGQVAVDGDGTAETLLRVTGADVELDGLVLDGAETAISVEGGDGASITGNVIGADAAGTGLGSVGVGVAVDGDGVTVSDNVVGAATGIVGLPAAADLTVSGNEVGVQSGGAAAFGDTELGVAALGPDATVTGNTVHGSVVGIGVLGSAATGATVEDNRVGVAGGDEVVLEGNGQGVRIDGAPDATVAGNVISSARDEVVGDIGAVVVTGGLQAVSSGDGLVEFFNRNESSTGAPPTATDVNVTGNVIGDSAVTGGEDSSEAVTGVLVWDAATGVSVEGNVIAGPERGVEIHDGSGHSVAGNRIGIDAEDVAHPVELGVVIDGAPDAEVGATGAGNTIHTSGFGVVLVDGSTGGSVVANEITATDATTNCVTVEQGSDEATVQQNTVDGCTQGITVNDVAGASVLSNVVQDPEVGLLVEGQGTQAASNVVLGAGSQAFLVRAADVTLEANLIGTTGTAAAIQPFAGEGIRFQTGSGTVEDNVVVGAGGAAITVATEGVVTLAANRLEDTTGTPIHSPNGPAAPALAAALQTSTSGTDRTMLLIGDLPQAETGTIEVFANDSCTDPEAETVLRVTAQKQAGRTWAVLPLIGQGEHDHFTATYTNTTAGTSALTNCVERDTNPTDGDGDGSPDTIEDLLGTATDPTTALLIADTGDVLAAHTTAGTLAEVQAVDDPAPSAHPAGFSLAYGTVSFEVTGLEPGGATQVAIAELDAVTPSDTYWKHGPQTPDGPAGWYRFTPDAATGTGATRGGIDLGPLGIHGAWTLDLVDGQRGDNSLFLDGTIVDPGGAGTTTQAFTDVGLTHPFFDDIGWMAAQNITGGYPNGTYRPANPVTRQAMSAFMHRLAGAPTFTPPATPTFTDVGTSHPFRTEIEWMAHSDITGGYPNGTYRPANPVTRQAMSAFMHRLAGAPTFTPPATSTFTDVPPSHPFFLEVEWMNDEGITTGYPNRTYRPGAIVTRQAMSAFMYRLHTGPGIDP